MTVVPPPVVAALPGVVLGVSTEPLGLLAVGAMAATVGGIAAAVRAHLRASQVEAALRRAEGHDVLTDLPNHAGARAALAEAVSRRRGALLLLELDRFGAVNESYGHEVGDRLLRSLAEQLERLVEPGEVLARWGGPRFAVLLTARTAADALTARAATLQEALNAKVRIDHDTLWVTATIGGVALDERFTSVDEVVGAATTALDLARAEGRGGRRTFDRTMTSPVTPGAAGDRVAQAMATEDLLVLYQPVVAMADRSVVGVEACVHWADPTRGVIGEDQLAAVLERSGLEDQVAERTLEQVLTQAGRWHLDHPSLVVTVPVPPTLLVSDGFTARLAAMLRASGADANELCLQVAGRTRADHMDLWGPLREISAMGVQIALDGFGTGWSSLAYLRRFNLDVLKVSPAFIATIVTSREDAAVVQQLVGLANALGLVPIAEGVTTRAQADLLTSLNCELGQGPWFGRPLPLRGIEAVLDRGKVDPGGRSSANIDWTATAG